MAIAASLWFDPSLEAKIRALWAEMAHRGITKALHDGPYRPHVTLGVWESLEHRRFSQELEVALAGTPPLQMVFGATGGFPGDRGVVYLQPGITSELVGLRESILKVAAKLRARSASWYPQGPWFPHCTIAWELDRNAFLNASDVLQRSQLPLSGFADPVGLIDTPAEVELKRIPFAT